MIFALTSLAAMAIAVSSPPSVVSQPPIVANLFPIRADGLEPPLDLYAAIAGKVWSRITVESSSCVVDDECRAEAQKQGRHHRIVVSMRRVDDRVIVSVVLLKDDAVVTDALEVAAPDGVTQAAGQAMARLGERLARIETHAADPDGDRIALGDECPAVAGEETARGCPDQDRDRVADTADQCPLVAGVEPHGCPDADLDGVFDKQDRCLQTPGPKPYGCPDTDEDGVLNVDDKCPAQQGLATAERPGCPETAPAETAGPEWGRISLGGLVSFLGTAIGATAGLGIAYLAAAQLEASNGAPFVVSSDTDHAIWYGVGAGLGALGGQLLPDVSCAGVCSYPLAASGWTRAVSGVLVTGLAGAGGAVMGVGLRNRAPATFYSGLGIAATAPIAGAFVTGGGNCASGPPSME